MSTAPRGRPDAPSYTGRTLIGAVGWTRIGLAAVLAFAAAVCGALQLIQMPFVIAVIVFTVGFAVAAWMRMSTRFIVDERGLTVLLGGFWKRPTWPVEDFRTVQLRTIPAELVGVSTGGYGWRAGKAMSAADGTIEALPGRKPFTTTSAQELYRLLVTRPGTMVEIIGREGWNYLISPEDPRETAAAVDQAIRARR